MVRSILRYCYRRLAIIVLVFTSAVMAGDVPPATLPQGFLEQLTLLMQLNDQEFEVLMTYAEKDNSDKRRTKTRDDEALPSPVGGNQGEPREE